MLFVYCMHSYPINSSMSSSFPSPHNHTEETMVQNGILDESEKFDKLGIEEDEFLPNIHIYYNDDLNYA